CGGSAARAPVPPPGARPGGVYAAVAACSTLVAPPRPPPASPPGVIWQGSPFPGLRHFTPDDAAIFFGRNQETTELLVRVQQERFVAVVGASGSGKSSLVAAGVLPRLHPMPGGQHWQWVPLAPRGLGDRPV